MAYEYVVRLPSLDYDRKYSSSIDKKAIGCEGKYLAHDTSLIPVQGGLSRLSSMMQP